MENQAKTKILIAGYPKSGNTWLNRLLAEVIQCPQAGYLNLEAERKNELATEGFDRRSKYEVWKTHETPKVLERSDIQKQHVIYLVRDVRDVIVSASHYFCHSIDMRIKKEEKKWCSHVNLWLKQSVIVVKYENLLQNTNKEIQRIFKYLNIKVNNKQINIAIQKQSFVRRKESFRKAKDKINYNFMRAGKSKQYLNEMNNEQIKRCSIIFNESLKALGYE